MSHKILIHLLLFAIIFPINWVDAQTKKGFDLSVASIPVNEIKDGGPPRDGIPSIDAPEFKQVSQANIENDARILGVYYNGIAKAYPINIPNFHEIVNDQFKGHPIVITYCPLCGSGIAFDAMIDRASKTFGVSGLLYNSDVLLYDRETETLWSQLMNEGVVGELKGRKIDKIATANTKWAKWKATHPETLVLSEKTGFNRDYTKNPYPGYASSAKTYFEVAEMDDSFHPKEMVVGLEVDGKHKAYPFSELEKRSNSVVEDLFQGLNLFIEFDEESQSAEIKDEKGNIIPTIMNFWFAWYAFYPDTEVFRMK